MRMQSNYRLTAEEKAALVDEYLAGATLRILADRYGIAIGTVADHLERRGIARRARGHPSGPPVRVPRETVNMALPHLSVKDLRDVRRNIDAILAEIGVE